MEVKRGSLIVAFLVLLSTFYATLTIVPETAKATTIYVGGAGPSNYTNIQAAVDAAVPGDTIVVFNGTYNERIDITKTLSLVGEDKYATILHSVFPGNVISVNAHYVNISGLTVGSDVFVDGAGMSLFNARGCNISNNRIFAWMYGIQLELSNENSITSNAFLNSIAAIRLFYSDNNSINGNLFSSTLSASLLLSNNNTIVNNIDGPIRGGFKLSLSDNNTIAGNNLNSHGARIALDNSSGNRVYHNYLANNATPAWDFNGTNEWDNGYPSGGNFWRGYTGSDQLRGPNQDQPGSDGIGDVPYQIPGGLSKDRYPRIGYLPPAPIVLVLPTCNITSPPPGSVVSGVYRIEGTADRIDGEIQKVEVKIDGGQWIETVGTTGWSFDWNTTNVSDGNHTIYARSFDRVNYSIEANVTVVVDNTPPTKVDIDWFWTAIATALILATVFLLVAYVLIRKKNGKNGKSRSESSPEEDVEI